ncbi:hypothetical protein [uncultured Aquimarina sp.]|uniref:hypothetical protein n=1 Tax=uncultured Aquimarina sp. TaxID=575652 RepID=UPI00262B9AC0|nr:hypothetical protein [uncultured Aquimarina sp.]
MSQVVFRGDPLYTATTFGYTPLSTIIVGLLMKLGGLLSLNTIESARIIGLLLYGSSCGSIFVLCKGLFKEKFAAPIACLLFCGLGYIQILSGVNAEPKLWVLLFSILGIHFFNRKDWLLVGLFFSLAAMSWHVAMVSLFATAIMLPWNSKQLLPVLYELFFGVFLGVLPVLFYLQLTDGWLDFWNQAIIRKLVIEGSDIGETPFHWIKKGIYPHFILESLHFVLALFGFLIGLYEIVKKNINKPDTSIKKRTLIFLIIYSFLWVAFNSLDFQTNVDLLPLIPSVIIFSTLFFVEFFKKKHGSVATIVMTVMLIFYNFFDAFSYDLPYTFSEQVSAINRLKIKYKKPFVIGYEEYYTILQKPMPTKFLRYANYEDHLIEKKDNGCISVGELIVSEKYSVVVEFDISKRTRSKAAQKLVDLLRGDSEKEHIRSNCATYIIENLTSSKEIDSFIIKYQSILFEDSFYDYKYYSVFEITEP